MEYPSTIVYKFSDQEVQSITDEIMSVPDNWWRPHFTGEYERTGALRSGKTVWLRNIDRECNITFDRSDQMPVSRAVIEKFAGGLDYGRAYWHRIPSGGGIDAHQDQQLGFSDKIRHRYQIYLNIPAGVECVIDNGAFDASTLGNCLLDFNMYMTHEYKNHSHEDFVFMVFDIFKHGNKI